MNVHATASAKHWSNDGDVANDLDSLEAERRAAMNEDARFDLASAPAGTWLAMGEAKSHAETVSMQRDLYRWAASLPPRDPARDRRTLSASERANRAATDRVFFAGFASPGCGHCPGCRGGRADWCTGWLPTVGRRYRALHSRTPEHARDAGHPLPRTKAN